jgi:hypothetical protein
LRVLPSSSKYFAVFLSFSFELESILIFS